MQKIKKPLISQGLKGNSSFSTFLEYQQKGAEGLLRPF